MFIYKKFGYDGLEVFNTIFLCLAEDTFITVPCVALLCCWNSARHCEASEANSCRSFLLIACIIAGDCFVPRNDASRSAVQVSDTRNDAIKTYCWKTKMYLQQHKKSPAKMQGF